MWHAGRARPGGAWETATSRSPAALQSGHSSKLRVWSSWFTNRALTLSVCETARGTAGVPLPAIRGRLEAGTPCRTRRTGSSRAPPAWARRGCCARVAGADELGAVEGPAPAPRSEPHAGDISASRGVAPAWRTGLGHRGPHHAPPSPNQPAPQCTKRHVAGVTANRLAPGRPAGPQPPAGTGGAESTDTVLTARPGREVLTRIQ